MAEDKRNLRSNNSARNDNQLPGADVDSLRRRRFARVAVAHADPPDVNRPSGQRRALAMSSAAVLRA